MAITKSGLAQLKILGYHNRTM